MSKTTTIKTASTRLNRFGPGSSHYFFAPGVDAYSGVRPGQSIRIEGADGAVVEGTVSNKTFGQLAGVVSSWGHSHYAAGGQLDLDTLAEELEEAFPDDPNASRISRLYTCFQITVPMPSGPGMPV